MQFISSSAQFSIYLFFNHSPKFIKSLGLWLFGLTSKNFLIRCRHERVSASEFCDWTSPRKKKCLLRERKSCVDGSPWPNKVDLVFYELHTYHTCGSTSLESPTDHEEVTGVKFPKSHFLNYFFALSSRGRPLNSSSLRPTTWASGFPRFRHVVR